MHIVILREDHLGDMILTTPLVRALALARHKVTVVGPRAHAPVWKSNPRADYQCLETLCSDWPRGWLALARWLRESSASHVLVPHYSPRLLVSSLFSHKLRRYCQIGGLLGRVTLHKCLRMRLHSRPRHVACALCDFAVHLGVPCDSIQPEIFLTEIERDSVDHQLSSRFADELPVVVVHPFHRGSSCNLRLPQYVEIVAELCRSARCNIIVTGTEDEGEQWQQVSGSLHKPRVWTACGSLTLRQFFAVIEKADVMVVGSTGPLQAASALGTRSVGVFCPHPWVGPELWRNLTPGSVELTPSEDQCPRSRNVHIGNCGFPAGPTPDAVADAVLAILQI